MKYDERHPSINAEYCDVAYRPSLKTPDEKMCADAYVQVKLQFSW